MAKDRATQNFLFYNATDSVMYRVQMDVLAGTTNVFTGVEEGGALKGTAVHVANAGKHDSYWIGNAVWGAGVDTQLHVLIDAM